MPHHRLLISAVVAAGAVPAVAAAAAQAPTITGPKSAAVGQTITVHATGLKKGNYELTILGGTPPNRDSYCLGRITREARRVTAVTLRGRIPATIPCFSGYPASSAGRTKVTPGAYQLRVSWGGQVVPSSLLSNVARKITITG